MKNKKNYWILSLIAVTILITIGVQFYWNYKNFKENRQRIINEIQLSLDNSLEIYFSELAKGNIVTIVKEPLSKKKISIRKSYKITSLEFDNKEVMPNLDSIIDFTNSMREQLLVKKIKHKGIKAYRGQKKADSLKLIAGINTIFISVKTDSIQEKKFDYILQKQLKTKNIHLDYAFKVFKNDTLKKIYPKNKDFKVFKEVDAKSTFLANNKRLTLAYDNPMKDTLKRSSTGIFISLFLALAVISSLFYLLKIIQSQKQLAEIKNDLISNITHEFKTPITTISASLEALTNFNLVNDKEKTQKYIGIAGQQTSKLSVMVEEILETATLNSDKLMLKKEPTDICKLLKKLTKKQFLDSQKSILFVSDLSELYLNVDAFHFENAISNLIDNAIKHGGDKIELRLYQKQNQVVVEVFDNGNGIKKTHRDKIFDKFYRIPKGNTHNVKGFGIGLYYTKAIIEKHNGTIALHSEPKNTVFQVVLNKERSKN